MSAAAVHADVTGTVTLTSDYDFRGFTQTKQDPAIQGSIDYTHSSGFYAGAWASNVDFGNCCDENVELDIYAGWRGGETIAWDLGAIYYTYPGADNIDFPEIYASATWKVITGKFWYSLGLRQLEQVGRVLPARCQHPAAGELHDRPHSGYSDGDYWGSDNYFDWSAGVTYALGHFNLNLKWVDGSDYKPGNDVHDDVLSTTPGHLLGLDHVPLEERVSD